jgi:uncharacterized protein YjbI with pentapeptide repeats
MSNAAHIALVKRGKSAVNAWRARTKKPLNLSQEDLRRYSLEGADLRRANLLGADLRDINLMDADLRGADLREAALLGTWLCRSDLRGADLRGATMIAAHLGGADFRGASLRGANLREADLNEANLEGADLSNSHLCHATLREATLDGANLTNACLMVTLFAECNLVGTNFSKAHLGRAMFASVDLSLARGLTRIVYTCPSSVGFDTLQMSKGNVPEAFLRGCGWSDWEIVAARLYSRNLGPDEAVDLATRLYDARVRCAVQISPVFISYSHRDSQFVDLLQRHLDGHGIRSWRDVHDLKAGRMESQLARAIKLNPTVVLVLSKRSVDSDWVEWEAAEARELEKTTGRDVLCPIALDNTWKSAHWPGPLRRQIEDYHVLNFSRWRDGDFFKEQFGKLLDGLKLYGAQRSRS